MNIYYYETHLTQYTVSTIMTCFGLHVAGISIAIAVTVMVVILIATNSHVGSQNNAHDNEQITMNIHDHNNRYANK